MRQVNETEFFDAIGHLNVTVTPKGDYPYRLDFCLKDGKRVGYVQDIDPGIGIPISRYHLD